MLAPLAAMALGAGCARSQPMEADAPLNVIVALADTLRADHMSCYGYVRETTAAIDALAESAVLFERARSQSACTFPSVNSLLTSRYPAVFHRQGEGEMGIPERYPSLPELLSGQGYATLAVSASPIVRATPSTHNPGGGFGRGFDVFDERPLWREAAYVNHLALQHLDRTEEPFFVYLHYMDPHDPYRTPQEFERRFVRDYQGAEFIMDGDPNPIAEMLYDDGPEVAFSDRDIEHLVDLYDNEIAYFDREFGKLVAALQQRGLMERTILVLLSDHGEEFMEHGHIKHCRVLFDSSTRTPMIVWHPDARSGQRVARPVQNIDVAPTIVDFLGVPAPEGGFRGTSLRPLIAGQVSNHALAFSDQGRWRSVDDGRRKLILDGLSWTRQLYDLVEDPGEQTDVYRPDSAEARRLEEDLEAWLQLTLEGTDLGDALAAARAKEDELRALGYLE
jgi:arylsulfatase